MNSDKCIVYLPIISRHWLICNNHSQNSMQSCSTWGGLDHFLQRRAEGLFGRCIRNSSLVYLRPCCSWTQWSSDLNHITLFFSLVPCLVVGTYPWWRKTHGEFRIFTLTHCVLGEISQCLAMVLQSQWKRYVSLKYLQCWLAVFIRSLDGTRPQQMLSFHIWASSARM